LRTPEETLLSGAVGFVSDAAMSFGWLSDLVTGDCAITSPVNKISEANSDAMKSFMNYF
jgi:hypothetical protein